MNTLVANALEEMTEGFSSEESDWGLQWTRADARRTTQMRFDAESTNELSIADAAKLLANEMQTEFDDLVVNGVGGGGNAAGNALLSAWVGSELAGKELTAFYVQSAGIWNEYKEKRKRWEYTLYCVVYVEYGGEPAVTWQSQLT